MFVECLNFDTRQRHNLCRVLGTWHTAKEESLSSAWTLTLGKRKKLCRVLELWHSAKKHSLPSAWDLILGKRAVTVSTPSHYFFRRASVSTLGKIFAECPIENTRQRAICRHCRCHVLFAEWFLGFAECPWHTAKRLFSIVPTRLIAAYCGLLLLQHIYWSYPCERDREERGRACWWESHL